jgi:hypothetical protein
MQTILKHRNIRQNKIKEIINITNATLSQNYFNLTIIVTTKKGLAMGSASSAIFLQFMECNNMHDSLLKHKIICYLRYVEY